MPGFTDYKLRMEILADGYKAKSEIKSVDDQIKGLGGTVADKLGGAAVPIGLAAGAIVGLGTAAVGTVSALFALTSQAAEYGAAIHDASDKTGLHAESLSAMSLAAKQSNTEMETVTGAIAKFAKTVGESADGSEKAAAKLKDFGITPKQAIEDLDGSLAKVFKRIVDGRPGIEQMTLAQKAFGKSGADLLPFIKQFDGDLPGLIKKAKELGLTMSDQDAAAADAFGDQLDELKRSAQTTAAAFTADLMPVFTSAMHDIETWIGRNKETIRDWGDYTANIVQGLISYWKDLVSWKERYLGGGQIELPSGNKYGWGSIFTGGVLGVAIAERGSEDRKNNQQYGPYSYEMSKTPAKTLGTGTGTGAAKKPPKETDNEFRKFFQQYGFDVTRTFGGALNKGSVHPLGLAADVSVRGKSVDDISKLIAAAIEKGYRLVDERKKIPGVNQTGPHLHFERTGSDKASIFQGDQSMYGKVPVGYLQELDKQRRGKAPASQDSIAQFNKKIYDEDLANWNAAWERKTQINQSGLNVMIQQEERRYQKATENADDNTAMDAAQQSHDLQVQLIEDEIRALEEKYNAAEVGSKEEADLANQVAIKKIEADLKVADADDELEQRKKEIHAAQNKRIDEEAAWVEKMLKYAKDLGDQYDELREKIWNAQMAQAEMNARQGEWIESLRAAQPFEQAKMEMADMITGAFEQFTQGVGSAVEAWVLYGEAGPNAMRKMTAQVLASLAAQAAAKALFYTAEGIVALFLDPPLAGAFFTAAAIMGSIAVGAAVAGRAVAGNSFKSGGGKSGGKDSKYYSTGNTSQQQSNIDKNPTPYSRASNDAYISGDRHARFVQQAIEKHTEALEKIHAKIDSMPAGDVLTRGMKERPGVVADQVHKDIRSDAGKGMKIGSAMGLR
jgi:hypothetical protein